MTGPCPAEFKRVLWCQLITHNLPYPAIRIEHVSSG